MKCQLKYHWVKLPELACLRARGYWASGHVWPLGQPTGKVWASTAALKTCGARYVGWRRGGPEKHLGHKEP